MARSERPFSEHLGQRLLFDWYLELKLEYQPFHPTTFMMHCKRFLEYDVKRVLLPEVVSVPRRHRPLLSGHFAVNGTLLDAWASYRCYRPRDENRRQATVDTTDRALSRAVRSVVVGLERLGVPRTR